MRFFHLSDLHIGKQLKQYNLSEDQEYILNNVVEKAKQLRPDAIIIAGDIYDKSVPSAEAVSIFDDFLTKLTEIEPTIPILIISGNHDSAQRLDFASSILKKNAVYIAGMPPREKDEYLNKIVLNDEYGLVNFYLLPFVKPGYVRHIFEENEIITYDDAVKKLLEREKVDYTQRNVLVAHQFFTANTIKPETCDSEINIISVGGLDNVDIESVKSFDYVALGHIHGGQKMFYNHIRYCGTLLKYSVSERNHNKSLKLVTLGEKGEEPIIEDVIIKPLRDLRLEVGMLKDIISKANDLNKDDYLSVILTDEIDQYKPKEQLETVYTHVLEVKVDNSRTRLKLEETKDEIKIEDPYSAFENFFLYMQGRPINENEKSAILEIINITREDN